MSIVHDKSFFNTLVGSANEIIIGIITGTRHKLRLIESAPPPGGISSCLEQTKEHLSSYQHLLGYIEKEVQEEDSRLRNRRGKKELDRGVDFNLLTLHLNLSILYKILEIKEDIPKVLSDFSVYKDLVV